MLSRGFVKYLFVVEIGFLIGALIYVALTIRDLRQDDAAAKLRLSRNILANHIIEERQKNINKARLTELNHQIPSFDKLRQFQSNPDFDNSETLLLEYIQYYEKVIETFGEMPDAYDMLGYCHYYLGDVAKSLLYYRKALRMNPENFLTLYNLGTILYRQGYYQKAAIFFTQAVKVRPEVAVKSLFQSKVILQIVSGAKNSQGMLMNQCRRNYSNSYRLLILSLFHFDKEKATKKAAQYNLQSVLSQVNKQFELSIF